MQAFCLSVYFLIGATFGATLKNIEATSPGNSRRISAMVRRFGCYSTLAAAFPMNPMGEGRTLCGLELVYVAVVAFLFQRPHVHRLLHPQPKPSAITK